MLLRGMKLTIVGTGLLLAVSANAQSPKFGFEYRAGLTYNDGNLEKTTGNDAQTSTDIELEFANITAEGEAAKNVNYAFSYDMLASHLDIGNVTMKFNDMMSFYAGRGKVAQGGWHHKDHYTEYNNVESAFGFGYSMNAPVNTYADSLGLQLNLAGLLSINAYNDVGVMDEDGDGVVSDEEKEASEHNGSGSHNDGHKSQLFTIEWMGNFNGWMPLVQLMSYDLNNSMAISAGVKGNVAGLGLLVNYTTDSRSDGDDEKTVYSQIDFHASYALSGFTPWLAFHQFAAKQPDTDSKINLGKDDLSDNAQLISLGVNCTSCGNGYVPYLSINSNSAKYAKDFSDASKEETKSGLEIKAGVMGKF